MYQLTYLIIKTLSTLGDLYGESMIVLPQVTVAYTRLLYQFWTEQGVPKAVLDDILKLDIYEEGLTEFSISSKQTHALHQAAVEYTQDPALGIKLGIYLAEQDLIISQLILTSLNLELALQALLNYSRVIAESGYFELATESDANNASFQKLTFIPRKGVILSEHQQNMVLAMFITWAKKILPNNFSKIELYCDARTKNSSDYAELLGCTIKSGSNLSLGIPNELLLKKNQLADLAANKKILKQIKKIAEKRINSLDFYDNVQNATKQCLLDNKANQENVAGILNITVRNLQRRLKSLGTNYQSILDESRKSLAMSLLADNKVALTDICYLLGFAEPSAFYKAFRRWTGKRPGDYRQDAIN